MKKNKDILIQYIGLIIACMIMAVGLNMFLVPKTIAPGASDAPAAFSASAGETV